LEHKGSAMKTALITGASSGIGLELTKQLLSKGVEVLAVCRKTSPELDRTGATVISGIELVSADLETKLQKAVGNSPLDLLWNNAGVFENESLENLNLEAIRHQFEVNTLAPLRVTQTLVGNLSPGSKIAITTSRMGSIEDNTSGRYYGYRLSKAAVNMVGKGLAVDLEKKGIAVALLHPGYVKTKMTGNNGDITPDASAAGMIKIVENLTLKNSGGFWHSNGDELPW
jgi:NAD(P)-dependent dehydrogenase (short-subunit alcohol dehydrogenase family)